VSTAKEKHITVLHINTQSDHGGASQSTLQLHHALNRQPNISSTFISGRRGAAQEPGVVDLGVPSWKLYANVLAFRALGLDGPLNVVQWRAVEPLIAAADIVHLHNVHGYYLPHDVLDRLLRKPTVWTLRDYWMATGRRGYPRHPSQQLGRLEQLWPWGGYDYPVEWLDRFKQRRARIAKLVARHEPTLVAITQDMAHRLSQMGVQSKQIQVIHNGVFRDSIPAADRTEARRHFGWSDAERIVLFVAAQIEDPVKGWAVLEKALHQLARPQDWHLVIVGEQRKPISRAAYPVRCTPLGPLKHPDVMTCFRGADLYVNPTFDEAFGRTTIEALGEGTDVLCSNIPVLQEIAGSLASFFPVGSSEGLAACLDTFRPTSTEARVERATVVRERFSLNKNAERYRALYQSIIAATPRSRNEY
jgi:putative colanic acid biosynthesis glycosyltransferase